jgi:phosphoribosylformylglycinamidine cyclo-ligase
MQRLGNVSEKEMFRTFNMGIGMIAICAQDDADHLRGQLDGAYEIGRTVAGNNEVSII